MSLYLFKELPLHLWSPNVDEVGVIRSWLLDYGLSAVENKLACIILEGLNWGFQPVSEHLICFSQHFMRCPLQTGLICMCYFEKVGFLDKDGRMSLMMMMMTDLHGLRDLLECFRDGHVRMIHT